MPEVCMHSPPGLATGPQPQITPMGIISRVRKRAAAGVRVLGPAQTS